MIRPLGLLVTMIGCLLALLGFIGGDENEHLDAFARVGFVAFGLAVAAGGVHMFRGKSQAIRDFDTWFAIQQKKSEAYNETFMRGGLKGFLLGFGQPSVARPGSGDDSTTAAQINAVSDPATATALQNLQKLLYTRAISDKEFQAAKDKLLRSDAARASTDAVAHVMQLVELHEAGILSDMEFAAAKLKALGLT